MVTNDQARILEKPLLSITDLNAKYKIINSTTLQNMTGGILLIDTPSVEKALKDLGQVFVERIITNENNLFYHQLDVFLSNQTGLDDCTYPVQTQHLTSLKIDLKQKTKVKASWNKLIIQNVL